jgi:hypothetical protein
MTADFNMAAAALAHAQLSFGVFPVWPALPSLRQNGGFICGCGRLRCEHPAKHPMGRLVPHGLRDATTDPARIAHLWSLRPDANIGGATGRIIALDIDPRHEGLATLARLEAKYGALPATWRIITGGGGEHIYFRPSPLPAIIRNSTAKLGPGLDVRGDGGYVLLPPSLHINGRRYQWKPGCTPDQRPLAALPSWLAAALAEPTKPGASAATWRDLVTNDVSEGKRNDTIARFAGHLLRRYVDPHVVLELLLAWNATRCKPPLGCDEITGIVNSIAGKEKKRRQAA